MKGKEEASERMLTEKEATQLSDTEFKAMVIRKLTEFTENYQKLQGNYNELTANYINMKKETETINKVEKHTQKQQEKEKRLRKNEEGLREMQDNMKCNNIRIIGLPEGKEEEQGLENLFEKVMMENFPNFMSKKVTQIQESQRVPIKRNPKRPTARHIIIKMAKFQDKERI